MNLSSRTLTAADEFGQRANRRDLRQLAEAEAVELARRARAEREQVDRDVLLEAPACLDVAAHVNVGTLADAIYNHALIHAGFTGRTHGVPYDVCPRCGDDLPGSAA